jgi:hypothetical protein
VAIRDSGDRTVLYALLAIVALGVVSVALLVISNGPPPKKTAPLSALPTSTTAPPTSGPAAAALARLCDQVRAQLNPLVPLATKGPVGRPAGVPVADGQEVVSCRMAVGSSGRPAIATKYRGTSIDAYAQSLKSYGWSQRDRSSKGATSEQLYTQLDGSHQIVLVGLPNGDLIALYDGT